MVTVKLFNRPVKAEESWAECSPDRVAELSVFCRVKDRDETAYSYLVMSWLRIAPEKWDALRLTKTEWAALKESAAWIWEPPTLRPFDFLIVSGEKLYLPKENFENSTAIELAMGFIHYLAYSRPEDPELASLDVLISMFCRKERVDLEAFRSSDKWNGDVREPYNEARAMENTASVSQLSIGHKIAFLNYFELMLGDFLETYGEVFGAGDGEERYAGGGGMIMILKNIAKEGHFGAFEQVCQQPANLLWAATLDDVLDHKKQLDRNDEG